MKLCVINIGLTHTVPRTIAIAPYLEEIHYVDVTGKLCANVFDLCGYNNIKFHDLREETGRDGFFKLIRLLKNIKPDVIVCHYIAGTALVAALGYGRCPVVGIAMGTDVIHEKGDREITKDSVVLRKLCYRQLAFIAAKSKKIKERLVHYGVTQRIEINYWGCNSSLFHVSSKLSARKELLLPDDGYIVLSLRAISPLYNIHLILEAFEKFIHKKNNFSKIYLLVVGRTSDAYDEYRKELEIWANNHNIGDNVLFIYDVKPETMPLYINASDCVISMAQSEGFPNSVFETWACKTPLIIGRLQELDELIIDGTNALYCNFLPEDIAAKMEMLYNTPKCIEEITDNGFETFKRFGDIHLNGQCFARCLEETQQNNMKLRPALAGRLRILLYYYLIKLKKKVEQYI